MGKKRSSGIYIVFSFFLLSIALTARAACPPMPAWADSMDSVTCDIVVDGITFDGTQLLTGSTSPGRKNPGCQSELDRIGACGLCNALWWDNHVHDAEPGADLSNPGFTSHIRHWVIKDSLHEGTTHVPGGHEDLLQPRMAINDGGWLIIQDSVFKNGDANGFINVGSSGPGYGNGPGDEFLCPGSGTGGVLFQGLDMAIYDPGYGGNNQIGIGGTFGAELGEVWLVGMHYRQGIGIAIWDDTGKVVVIGGSGGNGGWPGPLKRLYTAGEPITEATCPSGGWRNGQCCPNGLVNTQGQVYSWDGNRGDDPSDGAIPVYCYDDIETALADVDGNGQPLHQAPPLIGISDTGWTSRGWVNELPPTSNTPPSVTINSPNDNDIFSTSEYITFMAAATDVEDGDLSSGISWSSDRDGVFGSSASTGTSNLSVGIHEITAQVSDSQGASRSDVINITIEEAAANVTYDLDTSVLTGTGPAIDVDFIATPPVAFPNQDQVGTVSVEDGGRSLHLSGNRWQYIPLDYTVTANTILEFDFRAAGEGEIQGVSFETDFWVSDNLTFQLYGRDAYGLTPHSYSGTGATEHFVIRVGDHFTGVFDKLVFLNDDDSSNSANADATYSYVRLYEQGAEPYYEIPGGATWTSVALALYGSDAVTEELAATLSGSHSLTAGGRILFSSLPPELADTIGPNTAPTITITSPTPDTVFVEGEPVNLAGSANDNEDGDISASINWTSDLDGSLGQGQNIAIMSLSPGDHIITASVEDGQGFTGEATISISVVANTSGSSFPLNTGNLIQDDFIDIDFLSSPPEEFDPGQAKSGTVTVELQGSALHMTGNQWQGLQMDYTITPDTIIEFDIQVISDAEIVGLGFYTSDRQSTYTTFKLSGSQSYGDTTYQYNGSGQTQRMVIPVGQHFPGSYSWLTFVLDDDIVPEGDVIFSNISLYEAGSIREAYYPVPAGATWSSVALDLYGTDEVADELEALLNGLYGLQDGERILQSHLPASIEDLDTNALVINFLDSPPERFDPGQQQSGSVMVESQGSALHVTGNQWQGLQLNSTITPNTVIEFDIQIISDAEIVGVGFYSSNRQLSSRTFKVSGSQQNYGDTTYQYTGGGQVQTMVIPVGQHFTGDYTWLTFIMDDDIVPNGDVIFSNVRLYETN